jgi:hypothetical protein
MACTGLFIGKKSGFKQKAGLETVILVWVEYHIDNFSEGF